MAGLTYKDVGVDYDKIDPFKRWAQHAATTTAGNIDRLGLVAMEDTRGESCYLIKNGDHYLGHVEEGLGTKNIVADLLWEEFVSHSSDLPVSAYDKIGQSAVATIVNDMATLGVLPISVAMHLAVGASSWFEIEERSLALIRGWKKGCDLAGAVWSGGETPTLRDLVENSRAVISGSAMGRTVGMTRFEAAAIKPGDAIVICGSSGVHDNGLTLCRAVADKLPGRYQTPIDRSGRTYGDALLEPTHIYVPLVEACIMSGVEVHYCINVTGHGWAKFMRAPQNLTYVISHLPEQQPIFDFIMKHAGMDFEEAYKTFNMGAGFALYIPQSSIGRFWKLAHSKQWGYEILNAGVVKEGPRSVEIEPLGLKYLPKSLAIR